MSSPDPLSTYDDTELDRLAAAFMARAEELGRDAVIMLSRPPGAAGSIGGQYTGNFLNPFYVRGIQSCIPWGSQVCADCPPLRSHCIALAEDFSPDQPEHIYWIQGRPLS